MQKASVFDGTFYFAVRTTGIFCRPSCSSKLPKAENVTFFSSPKEAEVAGFRACKRCRPKEMQMPSPKAELVARALEMIRRAGTDAPRIEDISQTLGVSSGHLQRVFRSVLGVTPKEVMDMKRLEEFKKNVRKKDVTTSLYDSGYGSSRALYEKADSALGMTPGSYKNGGRNERISYTIAESALGKLLVASTEKGICAVRFGDTAEGLRKELQEEFFAAEITEGSKKLDEAVSAIIRSLDGETTILTLPLDLRATAFQMRVWSELRKIPYGETRSYSEIAERIGNPKAVRAVAQACARNPVALVTPCHRVIGSDGRLAGYRWGIERKKRLLEREKAKAE